MPGRSTIFSRPRGGERIFIGVVTEGHWQSFCREFGLQEFLDDPALRTHDRPDFWRGQESFPRVAEIIKRGERGGPFPRRSTGSTSASRRSIVPKICSTIPMLLRPGGLVNNTNADGEAFPRPPALPIEWNGASIGEGLKVPVLGADTSALRSELESARIFLQPAKTACEARMTRLQDIYPDDRVSLREVGLRDGLQLVKTFSVDGCESSAGSATNTTPACGISRSARSCPRRNFRSSPMCLMVVGTVAALPGRARHRASR